MASKKAGGICKNGRDSAGRRNGIKKFGGSQVKVSDIIARQQGTSFLPGKNVYLSKNHTIHAAVEGYVLFSSIKKRGKKRTVINITTEKLA